MPTKKIKAGETYLASKGGWLFEVISVAFGRVTYTNLHTGREGECTIEEFSGRVDRRLELDGEPVNKHLPSS
jgi:hypothetical protein